MVTVATLGDMRPLATLQSLVNAITAFTLTFVARVADAGRPAPTPRGDLSRE